MIAVPGASGKHTDGLVELVDLFPTVNIKTNPHTQKDKQEHTQTNKLAYKHTREQNKQTNTHTKNC